MPVYNAEKFIYFSIESILKQSYTNFEFIIIDDGSIDKSVEIIKSFKDDRIKFHQNHKNIGIVETLNYAINLANGEYIARMDADDISNDDRLELQYHEFNKNPSLILCGSWYSILYNSKIIKTVKLPCNSTEIKKRLKFSNQICHPSVMIKSNIAKMNKYNSNHFGCEDFGLWNLIKDKGDFINISLPLIKYRVHKSNVSLQKSKRKEKAIYDIISNNIFNKYYYRIENMNFSNNDIIKILKLIRNCKYEKEEFLKLINSQNIPLKHITLLLYPHILASFIKQKLININYKIRIILIERNILHI